MASNYRTPGANRGKYSPTTKMIAKTTNAEVTMHRYPVDEENPQETVALALRLSGMRKAMFWSLTQMTEEELLVMRHIFNSAFDTALPICIEKDKEARDAYERGDDSDPRIYRAAPVLVDRERGKRTHSALLQERPTSVVGLVEGGQHSDGEPRGEGPSVAEHPSENLGGQDNAAS